VTWLEVVEYTDPSCSWAWGTEGKYRRLAWQYGTLIRGWRRVMSGIISARWGEKYDFDPSSEQARSAYEAYLMPITGVTGMPRPAWMHYAMAWSEDACRVAKAAEFQGEAVAAAVLRRLRETWFVHGRPADTPARGLAAAAGVSGLDPDRLARDLADPATEAAYRADWAAAREPNDHVRNLPDTRPGQGAAQEQDGRLRYGLPCLILTGPAGEVTVAGWCAWADWEAAVRSVCPGAPARPLPTPAEAFARWPSLARSELDELCGPGSAPPPGVVEHRLPGGPVWLTERESAFWARSGS
jgi:protein-disulfide isomerase-like protein with CxxC motif